jgi:uncharacterized protein (TIGR02246 family)
MKPLYALLLSITVVLPAIANDHAGEADVRRVVLAFYSSFNNGFRDAADFATEEWSHIGPTGSLIVGRDNVLKEVREVHSTFLKGVSDTVDKIQVTFAQNQTAVVTVSSVMSTFVTPDGMRHENERHIRTFVVVKRQMRWLILQDQNTAVTGKQ